MGDNLLIAAPDAFRDIIACNVEGLTVMGHAAQHNMGMGAGRIKELQFRRLRPPPQTFYPLPSAPSGHTYPFPESGPRALYRIYDPS